MFNFEQFASDHHIIPAADGHKHCHIGWIQISCPFCGKYSSDGTIGKHLGFNIANGYFNCWRCGGHSVYTVVKEITNINDPHHIKKLIQKYTTKSINNIIDNDIINVARKRSAVKPFKTIPMTKAHSNYLISRKFNPKLLINTFKLEFTGRLFGKNKPWSWRCIAPIFDIDSNIVGYTGRSINGSKPKWLTSSNKDLTINPKQLLYGIQLVTTQNIIIVEGPGDVWRLGPGSVAVLGIDWNIEQTTQLKKYKNRYILFDPEENASKQAKKLANYFAVFKGNTYILDGYNTDPGDFSQKIANELTTQLKIRS